MDRPLRSPATHSIEGYAGPWSPGDRALIELAENEQGQKEYRMATLVKRDFAGQWWFDIDGITYPEYEDGPDLSFCVERWIHEPGILDKLAEI